MEVAIELKQQVQEIFSFSSWNIYIFGNYFLNQ